MKIPKQFKTLAEMREVSLKPFATSNTLHVAIGVGYTVGVLLGCGCFLSPSLKVASPSSSSFEYAFDPWALSTKM
jgi:hypothetical protein